MWEMVGLVRNDKGLIDAAAQLKELRTEFWRDVRIPGTLNELNQELEKAVRVADFFELGLLMCNDALLRKESCGAHFREESQTPEGEAKRIDDEFSYVAAWEFQGEGKDHILHKEELTFENIKIQERSYK